jgi:hypothetical protein
MLVGLERLDGYDGLVRLDGWDGLDGLGPYRVFSDNML